jgi:zinc protease
MHISIVGSFDEQEVIALLEKYVAGLPAVPKPVIKDNKVRIAKGQQTFRVNKGKEDKSLIVGVFAGDIAYSEALALKMNGLSDAINIIITEEMREKIQGIYGGGTSAGLNKTPYGAFQMILQLPCGPAKVDTLIASFNHELNRIANKGIDQSYVDKVKKAWIEKYKVDVKTNAFWLSALQDIARGERTADRVVNAEQYFNALSLQDLSEAATLVSKASSRIIGVQMPETATSAR